MSDLLRIIALLYSMQPEEVNALANELLERRKAAWMTAMSEKASRYGAPAAIRPPRLKDLEKLRRMAKADARQIARTWARDVERQLARLYQENPRGNRHFYASRMEQWARERAAWKDRQIALQTEQTTRFYAQQRFRQENGLTDVKLVVVGPPPVCQVCVNHMAARPGGPE